MHRLALVIVAFIYLCQPSTRKTQAVVIRIDGCGIWSIFRENIDCSAVGEEVWQKEFYYDGEDSEGAASSDGEGGYIEHPTHVDELFMLDLVRWIEGTHVPYGPSISPLSPN